MIFARLKRRLPEPSSVAALVQGLQSSLPKALLTGLIVVGGGSLLSAGAAQAVECSFVGSSLTCPSDITLGDKFFSDFVWEVTDGDGTSNIFGTVEFKWDELGAPGFADDIWTVDVDLNEGGGNVVGPASGFFSYRIDILSPEGDGWQFNTVSHDSNWLNGASLSTKVVDYDGGTQTLISENGNPDGPLSIGGKYVLVTDTWSVDGSLDVLDSFTNTFTQKSEVPGPLPLLGAGAAFGFSRRLRSRIKASRLA